MTPEAKLLDRILSKCVLGPKFEDTHCWLFIGHCCHKGYAGIKVAGAMRRAHRVLWELVNRRKIREGYTLDHGCLRTNCVQPEHLTEVSRPENTARGNRTRHTKEMRI